jgi:hypothetical protein
MDTAVIIIVIICLFILLFILVRPRPSKYVRDVTSTRNSHERGFGNY